jgi:Ca2+-transporting ATPase
VYENEPAEKNAMQQAPRPIASTFLSLKLGISIDWDYHRSLFVYQLIQNGATDN